MADLGFMIVALIATGLSAKCLQLLDEDAKNGYKESAVNMALCAVFGIVGLPLFGIMTIGAAIQVIGHVGRYIFG